MLFTLYIIHLTFTSTVFFKSLSPCYVYFFIILNMFVIVIPMLYFAGRCASCGENVVGEGTGCTAMDQVFHVECFICMTCGSKLRGKPFYAVEKKAYCEPCYIVSVICCTFFMHTLGLVH